MMIELPKRQHLPRAVQLEWFSGVKNALGVKSLSFPLIACVPARLCGSLLDFVNGRGNQNIGRWKVVDHKFDGTGTLGDVNQHTFNLSTFLEPPPTIHKSSKWAHRRSHQQGVPNGPKWILGIQMAPNFLPQSPHQSTLRFEHLCEARGSWSSGWGVISRVPKLSQEVQSKWHLRFNIALTQFHDFSGAKKWCEWKLWLKVPKQS